MTPDAKPDVKPDASQKMDSNSGTTPVDAKVDVVIIGAGTAGLSAMAEVKRQGKSFLIIDSGPLGTTCARVGCMPSKVLIELAHEFSKIKKLKKLLPQSLSEVREGIPSDSTAIFQQVREMRDRFVAGPIATVDKNREHFILGHARLLSPNLVQVGKKTIGCERVIVATGSTPIVPDEWPKSPRIVTSDSFFELRELPKKAAVIGAGPLGLELALAMAMFGVEVHVFDRQKNIGGLQDPAVEESARKAMSELVHFHLGHAIDLEDVGHAIQVKTGLVAQLTTGFFEADLVLSAIGRKPRLDHLGLESCGIEINKNGRIEFDPQSLQVGTHPIFVAGDCAQDRPVLHEASFEGQIAGHNACHTPHQFQRRTPIVIGFTHPQLARVGAAFADLDSSDLLIGDASFEDQGRAKIMGEAAGLLRIYARKSDGFILGAEIVAPGAEHLAQFLALAIESQLTVFQLLKMPFYHPTLMEGMKPALRSIAKQVTQQPRTASPSW